MFLLLMTSVIYSASPLEYVQIDSKAFCKAFREANMEIFREFLPEHYQAQFKAPTQGILFTLDESWNWIEAELPIGEIVTHRTKELTADVEYFYRHFESHGCIDCDTVNFYLQYDDIVRHVQIRIISSNTWHILHGDTVDVSAMEYPISVHFPKMLEPCTKYNGFYYLVGLCKDGKQFCLEFESNGKKYRLSENTKKTLTNNELRQIISYGLTHAGKFVTETGIAKKVFVRLSELISIFEDQYRCTICFSVPEGAFMQCGNACNAVFCESCLGHASISCCPVCKGPKDPSRRNLPLKNLEEVIRSLD